MGRNRTAAPVADPTATDAALAGAASTGDLAAFEELYRRHAQAAWRVAQAVTGNAEDAADAVSDAFTRVFKALPSGRLTADANFRAYLLSATRNAALDVHRRTGRVRPSADDSVFDRPSGDGPSEKAVQRLEAAMVATAFRSLPERWRSVLWLTEVEGIPAREAATMLGVSANGVAQLAVRARAGLRERFLQAHITHRVVGDGCRATVQKLGAYVGGALAPRDLAKVDQHLAGCAECRARKEELEDLGTGLRRIILPIPLGLGALAVAKWELASTTATAASAAAGALPKWFEKAQRPLAVVSAGLFAAGIVGVGVVGQAPSPRDSRSRGVESADDLAAPAVTFTPAAAVGQAGGASTGTGAGTGTGGGTGFGSSSGGAGTTAGSSGNGDGSGSGGSGSGSGGSGAGDDAGGGDPIGNVTGPTTTLVPTPSTTLPGGGPTTTSTTAPPTTTTTRPLAQVVISVTANDAIVVGTSCNGVKLTGTTQAGCPPPPRDKQVSVETTSTTIDPL